MWCINGLLHCSLNLANIFLNPFENYDILCGCPHSTCSCLGCFFTSSAGLKSFEHPLKELKPAPWMDSLGQQCGSTFVVVEESKQEAKKVGLVAGMPRVDSDADWSKHI